MSARSGRWERNNVEWNVACVWRVLVEAKRTELVLPINGVGSMWVEQSNTGIGNGRNETVGIAKQYQTPVGASFHGNGGVR